MTGWIALRVSGIKLNYLDKPAPAKKKDAPVKPTVTAPATEKPAEKPAKGSIGVK